MAKKNLAAWLEWIKSRHCQPIDLSLERVRTVAQRLAVMTPDCPVVIVGGTNGKGSCVAGLEAIYCAAGYRVGAFTSPFLFRYNEQVRLQGVAAADEAFCAAFAEIAKACGEITLTLFEWGALAALLMFKAADLDVWILEVGLGGRYDAVNILNADVAVITSISIDHVEWLGNTREAIAYEKAGIFRPDKPAVCGDFDPPLPLFTEKVKKLYCQNQQFGFEALQNGWNWWSETSRLEQLPQPALALQNMSTVLMVIELLQKKLAVSPAAIVNGLTTVILPGRIQVVPGEVTRIYDVSHNPASAQLLANYLQKNPCAGKNRAVFSMLADKDIVATLNVIKASIDEWEIAPLFTARAAAGDTLLQCFESAGIQAVRAHASIEEAFTSAQQAAKRGDRIVVFGSFHTVASVAAVSNDGALME